MRSGKNWSRPTFGDSFLPAVSAGGNALLAGILRDGNALVA